ncbi:hypothetical protein CABS01_17281 [Colletotrichum abscissum]|uniref:uncharacterized protein n=1 Tax=Colletotrichum abscissum TaxID=1671311 RepID=UPI0027D51937|nr:uncharacterized protein CABS01_17281 [Colletotrichum abscissum]KAK1479090.1 hypothetical protein CABS01_17281 [Colletotrichum abscissum]
MTDAGVVKIETVYIAEQHLCQPLRGHSHRHLTALSHVVQLLMQKYCKETPGIDDLGRWAPDSDGFAFLVAIDSASSVVELQSVRITSYI